MSETGLSNKNSTKQVAKIECLKALQESVDYALGLLKEFSEKGLKHSTDREQ